MWHVLVKGGWIMLPLLFCSLISMIIIIDRFFFFKKINSRNILNRAEKIIELVRTGLIEQALGAVEETKGTKKIQPSLIQVFSAGISHPLDADGAMEAAAVSEIAKMKRGFVALDTIITLSPLLGLLGTIIGMIKSFRIMSAAGLGQPHAVTGGVAEALIATASGIAIAVATLVPYNYFLFRVEQETDTIEVLSTRLTIALKCGFKE